MLHEGSDRSDRGMKKEDKGRPLKKKQLIS